MDTANVIRVINQREYPCRIEVAVKKSPCHFDCHQPWIFVIFEEDAKVVIASIVCSESNSPREISPIVADICNLIPCFCCEIFV